MNISVGCLISLGIAVRTIPLCEPLRFVIDQARAQLRVQECAQVITDFQALLAAVPAARIAAGVRAFLRSVGRRRGRVGRTAG